MSRDNTTTAELAVFDSLIEASKERLELLQCELRNLENEAALEGRMLSMLQSQRAQKQKEVRQTGTSSDETHKSLADHVLDLLREKGRPMQAAAITKALEERGVTTTSKRGLLPMVMSTVIRRKDVFQRTSKRGQYKLKPEAR